MKYIVFYFIYNGWKEYPQDFYVVETEAEAQELILTLAEEAQYEAYLEAICDEELSVEEVLEEICDLGYYAEYYNYKEANYYGR